MDIKLKTFIEDKLELGNSSLIEKRTKVKNKIKELEKVEEELEKYCLELEKLLPIKKIERKIHEDLGVKVQSWKEDEYCFQLAILFPDYHFSCSLTYYNDKDDKDDKEWKYEIGVSPKSEGKKLPPTKTFLRSILDKMKIEEDENPELWYGGKTIKQDEEACNEFKNLIEAVLDKQKKDKKK